jgi:hypothetical protein
MYWAVLSQQTRGMCSVIREEQILTTFTDPFRLNLQQFLWKDGGFSLHPRIPADAENLRVAEIGVGTG